MSAERTALRRNLPLITTAVIGCALFAAAVGSTTDSSQGAWL